VEPPQVRETIHAEAAFAMYSDRVDKAFKAWEREETPVFYDIDAYTDAKHFIAEPAHVLMERFSSLKLFDPYDVYEVLLKYWTDTMNDDLHLVVANGWEAGREIETFYKETENKKTKQIKKVETGWDGLLIPRKLIDARFFKAESEAVAKAEAALEAAKAELEDLAASGEVQDEDSQGSEEEVLRFAACGEDPVRLRACAEEKRKAASKALKAAQKKLETLEKAKYPTLSIDEIKELVVADKWIATVHSGIDELFRSISVALTERVDELARRYARPLGEIASETAALEKSVAKRLAAMGY
jgi:type I restriction enzyme M protein